MSAQTTVAANSTQPTGGTSPWIAVKAMGTAQPNASPSTA